MRGSSSRPQRQARSGVTYKESDDDDDEFVPNARLSSDLVGRRSSLRNNVVEVEELGIAKGKRTLTLKRPRTVEPPVTVAKENVDVYAIPEAAPEEKSIPSLDHGRQFPQVVESAEGVPNSHRRTSAFECLLEAVSGASGECEEEGGSTGQHSSSPTTTDQSESRAEREEEMTSAAYAPELLAAYSAFERKLLAVKGVKEEDTEGTNAFRRLAHSSDEESRLANSIVGEGMKDTVETERGKKGEQDDVSTADEKKYRRRSEKEKQDSMSSADEKKVSKKGEEDEQDNVSSADGKDSEKGKEEKEYNMSSADEDEEDDEDAEASWNESSDASDTEKKSSVKGNSDMPAPAKKPSQDLKTFSKKTKVPKKDPGTAGRNLMPAKSTSVPPLLPKKRPALWVGTKPFVSPGPLNLPSPTVAHRRVVGLSRRHRPPPLHPYLLGS